MKSFALAAEFEVKKSNLSGTSNPDVDEAFLDEDISIDHEEEVEWFEEEEIWGLKYFLIF